MNNFQRNIYRLVYEDLIPIITCSETANSGGVGVTEYNIILDKPLGGIIIIDFEPVGVPDKLEIIHNGIKKATTGMTTVNAGPFDNIYGSPTVPTLSEANSTDQFIGTDKGSIPNRYSTFLSETGITDVFMTKQQLVWWVYTDVDYVINNTITIRVTGINDTGWNLQRLCTDQTPTGVEPPPPEPEDFIYYDAEYYDCVDETCGITANPLWVYNLSDTLIINKYYYNSYNNKSFKILGAPKTYAEYTTLGSPIALETGEAFATIPYDVCTCLPIVPE